MSVMKCMALAGILSAALAASTVQGIAQTQGREIILAYNLTGDALVFRVPTGGCTTERSFKVEVRRSARSVDVNLVRTVPDDCKGFFLDGTEVSYALPSLGLNSGDNIQVRNRIGRGVVVPSSI